MMGNQDLIHAQFSHCEEVAASCRTRAGELEDARQRMNQAHSALLNSGLHGSFLSGYEARTHTMLGSIQHASQELDEIGTELNDFMIRLREFDSATAQLFDYRNDGWLVEAKTRTDAKTTELANLREQRQKQLDIIANILAKKNAWSDFMDGLFPKYDQAMILAQSELVDIDAQINALEQELGINDDITTYAIEIDESKMLIQPGNECMLYGAMNTLQQKGVNITKKDADALRERYEDARWLDELTGFTIFDSKTILDKYYDTKLYLLNPFSQNTREQILIDEIKHGDPVFVHMGTDFLGKPGGAHGMTVNGVNVDANGNIESVRLTTNWSGLEVVEMPADLFFRSWAGQGYQMITLGNKK